MRGESIANLPLIGFGGTKLIVNLDAARSLGLHVPSDLMAMADEVIGR